MYADFLYLENTVKCRLIACNPSTLSLDFMALSTLRTNLVTMNFAINMPFDEDTRRGCTQTVTVKSRPGERFLAAGHTDCPVVLLQVLVTGNMQNRCIHIRVGRDLAL